MNNPDVPRQDGNERPREGGASAGDTLKQRKDKFEELLQLKDRALAKIEEVRQKNPRVTEDPEHKDILESKLQKIQNVRQQLDNDLITNTEQLAHSSAFENALRRIQPEVYAIVDIALTFERQALCASDPGLQKAVDAFNTVEQRCMQRIRGNSEEGWWRDFYGKSASKVRSDLGSNMTNAEKIAAIQRGTQAWERYEREQWGDTQAPQEKARETDDRMATLVDGVTQQIVGMDGATFKCEKSDDNPKLAYVTLTRDSPGRSDVEHFKLEQTEDGKIHAWNRERSFGLRHGDDIRTPEDLIKAINDTYQSAFHVGTQGELRQIQERKDGQRNTLMQKLRNELIVEPDGETRVKWEGDTLVIALEKRIGRNVPTVTVGFELGQDGKLHPREKFRPLQTDVDANDPNQLHNFLRSIPGLSGDHNVQVVTKEEREKRNERERFKKGILTAITSSVVGVHGTTMEVDPETMEIRLENDEKRGSEKSTFSLDLREDGKAYVRMDRAISWKKEIGGAKDFIEFIRADRRFAVATLEEHAKEEADAQRIAARVKLACDSLIPGERGLPLQHNETSMWNPDLGTGHKIDFYMKDGKMRAYINFDEVDAENDATLLPFLQKHLEAGIRKSEQQEQKELAQINQVVEGLKGKLVSADDGSAVEFRLDGRKLTMQAGEKDIEVDLDVNKDGQVIAISPPEGGTIGKEMKMGRGHNLYVVRPGLVLPGSLDKVAKAISTDLGKEVITKEEKKLREAKEQKELAQINQVVEGLKGKLVSADDGSAVEFRLDGRKLTVQAGGKEIEVDLDVNKDGQVIAVSPPEGGTIGTEMKMGRGHNLYVVRPGLVLPGASLDEVAKAISRDLGAEVVTPEEKGRRDEKKQEEKRQQEAKEQQEQEEQEQIRTFVDSLRDGLVSGDRNTPVGFTLEGKTLRIDGWKPIRVDLSVTENGEIAAYNADGNIGRETTWDRSGVGSSNRKDAVWTGLNGASLEQVAQAISKDLGTEVITRAEGVRRDEKERKEREQITTFVDSLRDGLVSGDTNTPVSFTLGGKTLRIDGGKTIRVDLSVTENGEVAAYNADGDIGHEVKWNESGFGSVKRKDAVWTGLNGASLEQVAQAISKDLGTEVITRAEGVRRNAAAERPAAQPAPQREAAPEPARDERKVDSATDRPAAVPEQTTAASPAPARPDVPTDRPALSPAEYFAQQKKEAREGVENCRTDEQKELMKGFDVFFSGSLNNHQMIDTFVDGNRVRTTRQTTQEIPESLDALFRRHNQDIIEQITDIKRNLSGEEQQREAKSGVENSRTVEQKESMKGFDVSFTRTRYLDRPELSSMVNGHAVQTSRGKNETPDAFFRRHNEDIIRKIEALRKSNPSGKVQG